MVYDAFFDPHAWSAALEVMVKLGIGVVLAGAIGWEREAHGRPAGIRTHMLLVVGVILFTEASRAFAPNDPARIAAQVVTGVGFLGAGAIMRMGIEVRGLTTAASVWATSAIGVAVSTGGAMFLVACMAAVLSLVTLNLVDRFERRMFPRNHLPTLRVELEPHHSPADVVASLSHAGTPIREVEFVEDGPLTFCYFKLAVRSDASAMAAARIRGVRSVEWTD